MPDVPTPEEFRAVGFSAVAADHLLSEEGCAIVAEHNGVEPDRMPRAFRYAPNPWMHAWLEELGRRKAAGLPTRHESGRWLVPSELAR